MSLEKVAEPRGLLVEGAAAVVRVVGSRVSVVQIAGDEEPCDALLEGARSLGDALSVLNVPAGHPAGGARRARRHADVRQHELVLRLGGRCLRQPRRVSSATNPIRLWVASQNGFVLEWPHRQSTTALPSGNSNSRPSASTTVIGPTIL